MWLDGLHVVDDDAAAVWLQASLAWASWSLPPSSMPWMRLRFSSQTTCWCSSARGGGRGSFTSQCGHRRCCGVGSRSWLGPRSGSGPGLHGRRNWKFLLIGDIQVGQDERIPAHFVNASLKGQGIKSCACRIKLAQGWILLLLRLGLIPGRLQWRRLQPPRW